MDHIFVSLPLPTQIVFYFKVVVVVVSIMSNAAIQARANALNQKMEGEASAVLEDIERNLLRKVARESFACAVKCYDKAGATGPSDVLEACARNCQMPYQQSSAMVQNVSLQRCAIVVDVVNVNEWQGMARL